MNQELVRAKINELLKGFTSEQIAVHYPLRVKPQSIENLLDGKSPLTPQSTMFLCTTIYELDKRHHFFATERGLSKEKKLLVEDITRELKNEKY